MANVDNIIARQNELFGIISRTVKNLNKLGSANITSSSVKGRLDAVTSNWRKFQAYHNAIYKVYTPELSKLPYFTDGLYEACEELYLEQHATLSEMLKKLEPPPANESFGAHDATSKTSFASARKLPRIDLPTFSGKYSEWSNFRDLFVSMIHSNSELSAVEKLQYLKMSVKGEPAQHLKNIKLCDAGFERAWNRLVFLYENTRILIDAQLSILVSSRAAKTESSAELKRLLGDTIEALGALEDLGCPINQWDHLIMYLLVQKFDPDTMRDWEKTVGRRSEPCSFSDLEEYLLGRIHTLERIEAALTASKTSSAAAARSQKSARALAVAPEQKCSFCDANHYIASCPKFIAKDQTQRRSFIVEKRLCFNCLGPHQLQACRSKKTCRLCQRQHHTLLHHGHPSSTRASVSSAPQVGSSQDPSTSTSAVEAVGAPAGAAYATSSHVAQQRTSNHILLATALVTVVAPNGNQMPARALIDQGSELCFVTESLAQALRASRKSAAIPIRGIGANRAAITNGSVHISIISKTNPHAAFSFEAFVLLRLTTTLPSCELHSSTLPHLTNVSLADPKFHTPGKIDLLLGANLYAQIIEEGIIKELPGEPLAQRTALGWILSGPVSYHAVADTHRGAHSFQCSLDFDLLETLKRFWTLDEVTSTNTSAHTPDEARCEAHFKSTYSRDSYGRFIVRLPLISEDTAFGDSRTPALKMLSRLERKFESSPDLKSAYHTFLKEYLTLNHMRLSPSAATSQREFFLPHHGVMKATSFTTKLRVVFNGSHRTTLGISLNDRLMTGPKLQADLAEVLMRWRRHRIVFAGDITKMYRQIRVHPDDWNLQQIFWRTSANEPRAYQLCTVTYGLACAPYLAIRCLHQLANDSREDFPRAAGMILKDTYVDDILSGADTIYEAQSRILELKTVLASGGFQLTKWMANQDVLNDIPTEEHETSLTFPFEDNNVFRTLGILWDRNNDRFRFAPPSPFSNTSSTKRAVLSYIAQTFDPLGWLSPITIRAKLFMQELWAIRLEWDDMLLKHLQRRWDMFVQQLSEIAQLSLPRCSICVQESAALNFMDLQTRRSMPSRPLSTFVFLIPPARPLSIWYAQKLK